MSDFRPSNHFHFQPFPWKPLEMETPFPINTTSYDFHFQPFPSSLETYNALLCFAFLRHFQFPLFPYYYVIYRGGLKKPPIYYKQSTTSPLKEEPMKTIPECILVASHTKTEKRTAATILADTTAVLTTPNLLEKRHG
jgi:hypothetical protein